MHVSSLAKRYSDLFEKIRSAVQVRERVLGDKIDAKALVDLNRDLTRELMLLARHNRLCRISVEHRAFRGDGAAITALRVPTTHSQQLQPYLAIFDELLQDAKPSIRELRKLVAEQQEIGKDVADIEKKMLAILAELNARLSNYQNQLLILSRADADDSIGTKDIIAAKDGWWVLVRMTAALSIFTRCVAVEERKQKPGMTALKKAVLVPAALAALGAPVRGQPAGQNVPRARVEVAGQNVLNPARSSDWTKTNISGMASEITRNSRHVCVLRITVGIGNFAEIYEIPLPYDGNRTIETVEWKSGRKIITQLHKDETATLPENIAFASEMVATFTSLINDHKPLPEQYLVSPKRAPPKQTQQTVQAEQKKQEAPQKRSFFQKAFRTVRNAVHNPDKK